MRALIITANNFEDSELQVPLDQLRDEGIVTDVASLQRGKVHGKHGYVAEVDLTVNDVDVTAYDLLILPGGKAPAKLRKNLTVLEVVRAFIETDKPVAAICHGPQILISAAVLHGRTATCYKSVAAELKSAGAHYVDKEVVVDDNLITSRMPADLPAFMRAIKQHIADKLIE
jgi:protease I